MLTGTGEPGGQLDHIVPVRRKKKRKVLTPEQVTAAAVVALENPPALLKTRLKPRVLKRKRTVVPVVQVERTAEDQEAMDLVENVHNEREAASLGGRPSKYDPMFNRIVKVMARGGATDMEMAEALGISERTLNRWKHVYPEFCQSLVPGKEAGNDRVERSLYLRAVGYSYEEEVIGWFQGMSTKDKIIVHVPPDPKAAQYWLNNRRPKKWRNRQEITGADGKSLIPKTKHEMSRAELLAIANEARAKK
jgi:hypothetical protein